MGYTKRQIINLALTEIGIAEYDFDVAPEQLQNALERLDGMLAEWDHLGIRIFYPIPRSNSDSNLEDLTGIPVYAKEALLTNLAIRLSPSFGKTPSIITMANARNAYNMLLSSSTIPRKLRRQTMVAGAGNSKYGDPLLEETEDERLYKPISELFFE